MKALLLPTLALGAVLSMSSVALAAEEPVRPAAASAGLIMLTELQMDTVTAGSGDCGGCGGSLINVGDVNVGDINVGGDINVNVLTKDDCGCKKHY